MEKWRVKIIQNFQVILLLQVFYDSFTTGYMNVKKIFQVVQNDIIDRKYSKISKIMWKLVMIVKESEDFKKIIFYILFWLRHYSNELE